MSRSLLSLPGFPPVSRYPSIPIHQPLTSLFATLLSRAEPRDTKTPGVYPNSSHSGTRRSSLNTPSHESSVKQPRRPVLLPPHPPFPNPYLLSFHILPHSFALMENLTLLFSCDSTLFAKNHPGWGEGSPLPISQFTSHGSPRINRNLAESPVFNQSPVTSHESPVTASHQSLADSIFAAAFQGVPQCLKPQK